MNIVDKVIDLAVEIQQIPSPSFHEQERAEFVMNRFREEGITEVFKDKLHNVYARLPGSGKGKPLVLSAHLDTVFPIDTDLTIKKKNGKIYGPGIGDNSVGVAGLFGLLLAIIAKEIVLPGDLWLVANVAEEGLGNLKGMQAVVNRFGKDPIAYLVIEGMGLGTIYHRGLGVKRFRITARGKGGHSWGDYGTPSAIHEIIQLSQEILKLKVPSDPRTSINIGTIKGGTSINTIAAEASMEIDLRSEQAISLDALAKEVLNTVEGAQNKRIVFEVEKIGDRPAGEISKEHPLVVLAQNISKKATGVADLKIGSTDANIPLSLGYPAICVGLTLGGRAHSVDEFILTEPLEKGLIQLENLVQKIFTQLS